MAHKFLNASPNGMGNVLGSLYQKTTPITKSNFKNTSQKRLGHSGQNSRRHIQDGNAGHGSTSSSPHVIKKRKQKSIKKKKSDKKPKSSLPPKKKKQTTKKVTNLPDVF
jgi:hypothetical protein